MQIEQKILSRISKKVFELYSTVREYESDTFSAQGFDLTDEEAESIAIILINRALQDMIDTNTLDGVTINEELIAIREDNEE